MCRRVRIGEGAVEFKPFRLAAEATAPPGDDEPGMRERGRPERRDDGEPPPQAQRNFTDPDSRITKTRDGFVQGYNA